MIDTATSVHYELKRAISKKLERRKIILRPQCLRVLYMYILVDTKYCNFREIGGHTYMYSIRTCVLNTQRYVLIRNGLVSYVTLKEGK